MLLPHLAHAPLLIDAQAASAPKPTEQLKLVGYQSHGRLPGEVAV